MARKIINPHWGNQEKTHIIAGFRYDDGREVTASITNVPGSPSNSDWVEIMETFGEAGVDANSKKNLDRHMKRKQDVAERRAMDIERQAREALFNVKAEIFDMDVVKNSTNRDVKNKIRRATTINEAQIYAAVLHMMEDPIVNKTKTS
jgi:hypothetical protein